MLRLMGISGLGPTPKFTDMDIYWVLYILSDGTRKGRKYLSDTVGIGEGSLRKIIQILSELNMINIYQTGAAITNKGKEFLSTIPIRPVKVDRTNSVVGEFQTGVLVLGAAGKIHKGVEQRNDGIRVGASGCTSIVIRDDILMVPPDWDLDSKSPDFAANVRANTGITPSDVLIIGGGDTCRLSVSSALYAAFNLL